MIVRCRIERRAAAEKRCHQGADAMEDIYIAGVGMTPFGRMLDVDIKTMTRQATEAALADAGIDKSKLQAAYFANVSQGHMERQHMIRGEIALRSMGIGGIPVVNVENACASGSTAFNTAVNYVKAGQGDVALAIGAEKMYSQDRELMFSVAVPPGNWSSIKRREA